MYKDILQSIAGIEVFPVISLVLFVVVFMAVIISVARMDRARADGLAALPLEESADRPHPENAR
ncbi:MAG TPA: hypothetical protein VFT39_20085 [Vicinamibacterales bacterium]|nr:hypothetical protein [Vicinamibacterales bacterium]